MANGRPAASPYRALHGPRSRLRTLFDEAEDSAEQLDSYLKAGQLLVVGRLQLVDATAGGSEIKRMAVQASHRGRGIGRMLIQAAIDLARAHGRSILTVATAAADISNLRFYQLAGFRMRSVERDAFSPATGYAAETIIDGIRLRDRVWLDRDLDGRTP
jgi:GNAT superfamily N-acetyltransferase